MSTVNGHAPETPPLVVARAVYNSDIEDGDLPFDDLSAEEREALVAYADEHIRAFTEHLAAAGFKLLPPGAAPIPKSDEEAAGMLVAVKAYRDGKKRKGGLLLQDKKLIMPPGVH